MSTSVEQASKAAVSAADIPVEIWDKIFQHLGLQDLQDVRLSWKLWADAASRYLLTTFVFRPDRDDFGRFEKIAKIPSLRVSINTIRFAIGTLGFRSMAIYFVYNFVGLYNLDRIPDRERIYAPGVLEKLRDSAVEEYGTWNSRWHKAAQNYQDIPLMVSVFSQLHVLDRLDITRKDTKFKNILLQRPYQLVNCNITTSRQAVKELETILLALTESSHKPKHLSHDAAPASFFALHEHCLGTMLCSLYRLETLHITVDTTIYRDFQPHTKTWSGLGLFLRSLPNLRDLRFGIDPVEADLGTWQETGDGILNWYVPLWKMLDDYVWGHLEVLRIDGLLLCEHGLSELLARHTKTLRSLQLNGIGLWQGSFKGLLTSLRTSLDLEMFQIWGQLRAFHSRDGLEAWAIRPGPMMDTEVWCSEYKEFVVEDYNKTTEQSRRFGDMSPATTQERLESFVLSKEPQQWVLDLSDIVWPILRRPHRNTFHEEDCCSQSMADINRMWDEGINESMDTPFYRGEELFGVSEEEPALEYDSDGFDQDGFDEEGYNGEKVHYRNVPFRWGRAVNPISPVTCERDFIKDVKQKVAELRKAEQSE